MSCPLFFADWSPAPPLPADSAAELAALELDHRTLVAALRRQWSVTADVASVGEEPSVAARVAAQDALNQLLYAVSAALLTGDPRPVPDTSRWIADLMQTRGVTNRRVRELGEVLAATLRDYPRAQELVERNFARGLDPTTR
jgi:MerR family transcriptional regulator, light-induced transcriptional regulator